MTIKRYILVPHTTAGPDMSAAASPDFVTVAAIAGRALVKQTLPNGTAATSVDKHIHVADLVQDAAGGYDFDTTVMIAAAITTITNWLTLYHPAAATAFTNFVAAHGGTITRKQFALWVIAVLMSRADLTATQAVYGSDEN